MLDLSDGLALDARRIGRASAVGLDFSSAALGGEPDRLLGGGEDHSLLACFPPHTPLPGGFRAIGTVVAGEGLSVDGVPWDESLGWDPYRGWDGAAG